MWTYKERLMSWYHQVIWIVVLGMPMMILYAFISRSVSDGVFMLILYFSMIFIPPFFRQLYHDSEPMQKTNGSEKECHSH